MRKQAEAAARLQSEKDELERAKLLAEAEELERQRRVAEEEARKAKEREDIGTQVSERVKSQQKQRSEEDEKLEQEIMLS